MTFTVAIVGAGLVGPLLAILLVKRGANVLLFEKRSDLRKEPTLKGRSINLALSVRGMAALEEAGVLDIVKSELIIPMAGRMLHHANGKEELVPYGDFGEAINSVDRRKLNEILLDEAEKYGDQVKMFFEHELLSFEDGDASGKGVKLSFKSSRSDGNESSVVTFDCDLVVGADGAYSSVRRELMKKTRFNYQQDYIDCGYMELTIPATDNGEYAMHSNSLHIWPRKSHMMIALPNKDKSFTTTLFLPFHVFESIKTPQDLHQFFLENFPDSLQYLPNLDKEFFSNPVGPLVTVKCKPYNYKDKAVIIGDASHAMVPFYGQGMNCGFEDCLVLTEVLYPKTVGNLPLYSSPSQGKQQDLIVLPLEQRLDIYTEFRHPDATAVCDLALYNYYEMRHGVITLSYRARKTVESILHRILPQTVIPLYTMVSFSQIRYSDVIKRWKRQGDLLNAGLFLTAATVATLGVFNVLKKLKN